MIHNRISQPLFKPLFRGIDVEPYYYNASWIKDYSADQQAIIHALKLNKDDAFTNSADNPIAAFYISQTDSLELSGNDITKYLDAGGRGRDTGEQTTGTARPLFDDDGINSIGTSEYDGNNFMRIHPDLYTIPNGSNFIMTVAKRDSETAAQERILTMDSGSSVYILSYSATSGLVDFSNGSGTASNTGNTNTNYNVIAGNRSGTNLALYVSSNTASSSTGATDAIATRGTIGAFSPGLSLSLTGKIAFILILNRAATTSEIQALNAWAGSKYNITIS